MPKNNITQSKWLIILLGTLTALDPLTIDMYLPAFGSIQSDLKTTPALLEVSVTTFFFGMAFGQLIYGPLADKFGRKKPLQVGMVIYFIATIGCAFAPNIETFITLRFFQALGGCAGMTLTRAIIRDLYDTKQVASFLSNMALIMGLAPITAPSIGALINDHLGWRAIFFILAALNIICLISISFFLPETGKTHKNKLVIANLAKNYFSLLKNRQFMGYLIPDTAARAGMFAYIAGSPYVFIQILGIPASQYGYYFGLNGIGLMLASQLNRKALQRFSPNDILAFSLKITLATTIFVFSSNFVSSGIYLLGTLFIFLFTLNFTSPNTLALALESQGHQAGTASAMYGCFQWLMATISSSFVGLFHNGSAYPMTGVILFCGILSFSSYLLLIKRKSKPSLQQNTLDT